MGSMTNEAAFIELLHTLMQRQRETNAEPETETQAEPTLASAFAQGEINNTFIYTYVRYECVCMYVCVILFPCFSCFFLATVITRHLSRLLSNEK